MAIYHLSLKVNSKGSAVPHFNYICALNKYAKKRGVVYVGHGNMPTWASGKPVRFWQASDKCERSNGTVYRELEVSLPRELPLGQQIKLANELAKEACGEQHAFSFAIHHAKASDDGLNPHIHLQFSERIDDGIERDREHYFARTNKKEPEKGGCIKDKSWQARVRGCQKFGAKSSSRLLDIRQEWAKMCNQALEDYGESSSIDCRSYEVQGIDLIPQPKLGVKTFHQFQRKKIKNERYQRWENVVKTNRPILCDIDRIRRNKLQDNENELQDDIFFIRKELGEMKSKEPSISSKNEIIKSLVPKRKEVRKYIDNLQITKRAYTKAKDHYQKYCNIMDAPLKWGNIREKFGCWFEYTSRSNEETILNQVKEPYDQALKDYDDILEKAKNSPILSKLADEVLSQEKEDYQDWHKNIDVMERHLISLESSLENTSKSLDFIYEKHPDMDKVTPEIGLNISLKI